MNFNLIDMLVYTKPDGTFDIKNRDEFTRLKSILQNNLKVAIKTGLENSGDKKIESLRMCPLCKGAGLVHLIPKNADYGTNPITYTQFDDLIKKYTVMQDNTYTIHIPGINKPIKLRVKAREVNKTKLTDAYSVEFNVNAVGLVRSTTKGILNAVKGTDGEKILNEVGNTFQKILNKSAKVKTTLPSKFLDFEKVKELKNLIQYKKFLEKKVRDFFSSKTASSKKLSEPMIEKILNSTYAHFTTDVKKGLKRSYSICPLCEGDGYRHVGHAEGNPSAVIMYELLLKLAKKRIRNKKNIKKNDFTFSLEDILSDWVAESLKGIMLQDRIDNIRQIEEQEEKQKADAAYKKLKDYLLSKMPGDFDKILYPTPFQFFSLKESRARVVKKDSLANAKMIAMLSRYNLRDEFRRLVLEKVRASARKSDRSGKHMKELLEVRAYGGSDNRDGSVNVVAPTVRKRRNGVGSNTVYAKYYSDWSGFDNPSWSRTSQVSITKLVEEAFREVWKKVFKFDPVNGVLASDGITYDLNKYMDYVVVFSERRKKG